MKTRLSGSLLALALVGATPTSSAADGTAMWGCAAVGERRNILYLADQGRGSYIKFSGQRIAATLTSDDSAMRWTWGSNAMVLDTDDYATYYEGDTVKAQFKCRKLE